MNGQHQALSAAIEWIVHGDAIAQALLCVALLLLLRDALALGYRRGREPAAAFFPPVSVLKPVHGREPLAEAAFRSYCRQEYPGAYEVLFLFEDAGQPLYPLARTLAAEFPDRVSCVLSGPAQNPLVNGKSHNLAAGAAAARFAWLLVSDSDTIADPGTLRRLVAPLADQRVRAVAATPRITHARGLPARLERLLVNVVLAPFEYAAAQLHGSHGLWGTLLLVHRGCVEGAGGFAALGRYLTEDIALEEALYRQGFRGALLRRPVDVVCAEMSAGELLQHWHRWLVGLRRMRFGNWLGMGLILLAYLIPPVVIVSLVLQPGGRIERLAALVAFAAVSACSVLILGLAGVGVREPLSGYLLLPAAIAVLFLAFCRSIVDASVIWRGRRLLVGKGGRIVPPRASPVAGESTAKAKRT